MQIKNVPSVESLYDFVILLPVVKSFNSNSALIAFFVSLSKTFPF